MTAFALPGSSPPPALPPQKKLASARPGGLALTTNEAQTMNATMLRMTGGGISALSSGALSEICRRMSAFPCRPHPHPRCSPAAPAACLEAGWLSLRPRRA